MSMSCSAQRSPATSVLQLPKCLMLGQPVLGLTMLRFLRHRINGFNNVLLVLLMADDYSDEPRLCSMMLYL